MFIKGQEIITVIPFLTTPDINRQTTPDASLFPVIDYQMLCWEIGLTNQYHVITFSVWKQLDS